MTYTYAEIDSDNSVRCLVTLPFPLQNGAGSGETVQLIDVTDQTRPEPGYIYDPETQTFSPPEPTPDPYLGDLTLESVTGGLFSDETELNVNVGQKVTVTGRITRDGQTLSHFAPGVPFTVPIMRLPLLPTDLEGNPMAGLQPSMAVASINEGIVTATWTPEFTGTYAITEDGINIRLENGKKFRFKRLQIFVLPESAE